MQLDEEKVKAIHEWPTPINAAQVRSFHGLAGFYRLFVKDFSTVAAPLTDVMKKHVSFKWGHAQEEAFQAIKHKLINPPLLALQRLLLGTIIGMKGFYFVRVNYVCLIVH